MKNSNKYALIGVVSLAAAVALVAFGAPNAMAAAINIKPLPIIIDRKCSQPDEKGVTTCTLTYEGGSTQEVKIKDGKIINGVIKQ